MKRVVALAIGSVVLATGCGGGSDANRRCDRAFTAADLPLPSGQPVYDEPSTGRWTCAWGSAAGPQVVLIARTFASDAEVATFLAGDRSRFEPPDVSEPTAFAAIADNGSAAAVLAVGPSVLSLDLVGLDLTPAAALRVLEDRSDRILRGQCERGRPSTCSAT